MNLTIQENCDHINWDQVRDALEEVGMGNYDPDRHRLAFQNSFAVVFVFCENRLIGFGRAISDGAYQAAIYDIVVLPAFQRKGMGSLIMERLLAKIAHCNTILYANPGKEGFYLKSGFRFLKSGMGRFLDPASMKEKGMIS